MGIIKYYNSCNSDSLGYLWWNFRQSLRCTLEQWQLRHRWPRRQSAGPRTVPKRWRRSISLPSWRWTERPGRRWWVSGPKCLRSFQPVWTRWSRQSLSTNRPTTLGQPLCVFLNSFLPAWATPATSMLALCPPQTVRW